MERLEWMASAMDLQVEVHAFLKEHGVALHYSLAGLEEDRTTSQAIEEEMPDGQIA